MNSDTLYKSLMNKTQIDLLNKLKESIALTKSQINQPVASQTYNITEQQIRTIVRQLWNSKAIDIGPFVDEIFEENNEHLQQILDEIEHEEAMIAELDMKLMKLVDNDQQKKDPQDYLEEFKEDQFEMLPEIPIIRSPIIVNHNQYIPFFRYYQMNQQGRGLRDFIGNILNP